MEDPSSSSSSSSSSHRTLQDLNLASRKAEESALRRFQASAWLESFVGPLNLPNQPSEQQFVSCLRNGLVLCNLINKIEPGTVPKVIESYNYNNSATEPLPAYQYFENVRNFLVAVEGLNLPAFEASDLGKDSVDGGSTAKIVDCILSLKSYHEWKQWSDGSGGGGGMKGSGNKHLRSPMMVRAGARTNLVRVVNGNSAGACRNLDMGNGSETTPNKEGKIEDSIVGALVECLLESKENVDYNLLASFRNGTKDSAKVVSKILSSCLQGQQQEQFFELKSILHDHVPQESDSRAILTENCSPNTAKCKLCRVKKESCSHWKILEIQEKDLLDIKSLLSMTKNEFEIFQSQLQKDFQALGSKVEEMSFAARGYQIVIKENRDLYNMVQDLKGNIRVYCRIRPIADTEAQNTIDHIGDDGSLVVLDPLKPQKDARKLFQFNHVFGPTSTQDEVYKETRPLIRSVMDGYNVCIFAYGQTGSGKTHTMCGPSGGSSKDMGINYLALNDLFEISCSRKDTVDYEIHVQMVEIYNEQVRDLLTEDSSTTKLEIRNCTSNGGLSLPDATMHVVTSSIDVLTLMKLGETNRCVSSTALNNQSSRSHSVLTVHVHGKDTSGNILRSCLHLVDLAGSERVDKSEVTGDRLKEAQHINKSLSCLGDVIMALAQKNSHIPYRNSKLTQLLQDSLGGHAKTLMFAHVSPEADSYGETISTLKFAQRVSTVELGSAHVNKESREVKELKEQVETLKKALLSRPKDVKSPRDKFQTMTQRTPPRLRRLSIENTVLKTERTPLRLRRLSIENSIVKTPRSRRLSIESAVVKTDRTPPRLRRLSTENSAVKTEELVKREEQNVPKAQALEQLLADSPLAHIQKVNLEVPVDGRDQLQNTDSVNVSENVNDQSENSQYSHSFAPPDISKDSSSSYGVSQNKEASISSRNYSDTSSVTNVYRPSALRSPPSVSKHRVEQTENRLRRPMQLAKTPEATSLRARVFPIAQVPKTPELSSQRTKVFPFPTLSEHASSSKLPTPAVAMSTTSKKGSQIKRSLHTLGKLIHPSDKRSNFHPVATLATSSASVNIKSPVAADSRTQRRQSLTGGQTTELSRRSSLGGNPTESYSNTKRNAKTPPPVHPSTKASRQWF